LAAALVPFGFYVQPLLGLIFIVLSGTADALDGVMARTQNQVSSFGAFLDSSLDRFSDAFYLLGFLILFRAYPNLLMAALVMFIALMATLVISYVKARAEALQVHCKTGIMERGIRILYLIAWSLVLSVWPGQRHLVLWIGLILYAILTLTTAIQRICDIRDRLAKERSPA
jgi:phosphatidylglycerophosphate synthase